MKYTKYLLGTLLAGVFLTAGANAQYIIYTDQAEFENAKGAICEAATDGCNNYFMSDGKVAGGTRMFCENHTPEWNCTKYKENSISTMSITTTAMPTTTSVEIDTTSAVPILYDDATPVAISANDRNFLSHLRNTVKESHQKKTDALLFKIEAKTGKMHPKLANKYYDKWLKAIDKRKFDILMKYPQDVALPKNINNQYLVLSLLELEIEINLKNY